MSGVVYVAARRNGGSHPKLHTDRDCRTLQDADTVSKKDRSVYPDDTEICKICAGGVEQQTETDWSAQEALKNASADDFHP